jgi:hypothetical protein
MPTITEEAAKAIYDAVAKRGPRKGYFKASAPRSNTLAYAAWQAGMMAFNPYKASIFGLMCMSDEQRAIYNELLPIFDMAKSRGFHMDKDREVLESLGAW